MKTMQSFLIFYYILDQSFDSCKKDDIGGFLGAISPELWEDGKPADKAIFNDWQKFSNPKTLDKTNIMERIYNFLEYYEKKFGFDFSETKQWFLQIENEAVIKNAYDNTQLMYQKFQYDN